MAEKAWYDGLSTRKGESPRMTSADDTIQAFWSGKCLSSMERLSLMSFVSHGHKVELYTYRDVGEVPKEVRHRDAREIIEDGEFVACRGQIAEFADWFRYELLYRRGGWWIDLDVICLKTFDFASPFVFASERDRRGRAFATNCVMKAPKGAAIMGTAARKCKRMVASGSAPTSWGRTGPDLIHGLLWGKRLSRYVRQPGIFCPIDPQLWMKAVCPNAANRVLKTETYAVHLWNEMWRRVGADKDAQFAPASLYETLKVRYMPE